jgi:hypothetical protein
MVYRGGLQEPDGRLEQSTEESTVGPYHAGCGTNAAYSNHPMREKCLTKIGGEAGRHCRDVVGIGRIGFVAVRAWCAGAATTAGTTTQERPVEMIFANPPRIVAPGAVPHRRAPLAKENQCRRRLGVPRMNSPVRLTFVVAATAGQCCDTGAALGEGCLLHSLSSDVPGAGALA